MSARVEVSGEELIVSIEGWHKVWTLKDEMRIPLRFVERVASYEEIPWPGVFSLRAGTNIPGWIAAGSIRQGGAWSFWDVVDAGSVLAIYLRDHFYERLVIEVERPHEKMTRIQRAREGAGTPHGRI